MQGFIKQEPAKEVAWKLPTSVEGLKILIRCGAGIGDTLVAVGSISKALKDRGAAKVDAATMKHQSELIAKFETVDDSFDAQIVNRPEVKGRYDVILDVSSFPLANSRQLVGKSYYEAAFDKAGLSGLSEPSVGNLQISHDPDPKLIGIHASASNPIRRWPEHKWETLGRLLVDAGYEVRWFGTLSDFHVNDHGHEVVAQQSEDLTYQAQRLAECGHFIGNDSGFAHLAGVIGIHGAVIFGACMEPEHVIGHYPTLTDVCKSNTFSRSVRNDDPESIKALDRVTPDDVVQALALDTTSVREYMRQIKLNKHHKLAVCGNTEHWLGTLKKLNQWFDVMILDRDTIPAEADAVLLLDDRATVKFRSSGRVPIVIARSTDAEVLRKEIRMAMGMTWPKEIQCGEVLLSRVPGLGDVIMSTSVLYKAHEFFPHAKIVFHTSRNYFSIIKRHDWLTLTDDEDYTADLTIKLDYYGCWNEGTRAIHKLGGNEYEMQITHSHPPEVDSPAVGFWGRQGANPNIVKEWPENKWLSLAELLGDCNCYQLGSPRDKPIGSDIVTDLRCNSVEDMIATLRAMDVVVTIDGAAQHACRALGIRAVVLWGKSASPELIGYPLFHINEVSNSEGHCFASIDPSTFAVGECCGGDCMSSVKVGPVHSHVRTLLAKA